MKKPLSKASPAPRLALEFHPRAYEALRELHATGLFGPTLELVVEGLALSALRDAIRAGWLTRAREERAAEREEQRKREASAKIDQLLGLKARGRR